MCRGKIGEIRQSGLEAGTALVSGASDPKFQIDWIAFRNDKRRAGPYGWDKGRRLVQAPSMIVTLYV
jgi:hypothetical protein